MQKLLNLKIKFRESFRPFAPSVLYEDAKKWFDLKVESPYMLIVANLKKKGKVVSNLENSIKNSCSYPCRLFSTNTDSKK